MDEYPNELEIEKKLLSAMWLKDGLIIPNIVNIVEAEDFYRPQHRMIFQATVDVYNNGTPPEVLLVENELERRGELGRVERYYLHSLIDMEFSTARAETYARKIKEASLRRKMIYLSKELIAESGTEMKSIEELVNKVEQMATTLTTGTPKQMWQTTKELFVEEHRWICNAGNSEGLQGVRTGLYDLDEMTGGGLKATDLIILAARPSMGKTALALNIAIAAARDVPVLIFSLEMSKAQLMHRISSFTSGVKLARILAGNLTDREKEAIESAMTRFENRFFAIDDTGDLSISALKMRARQFKYKHGLGLIVIDYLQLIQSSTAYVGNRVQEVSEVSRKLKALAKELNVPVLALSQLSRNLEMRADKRPMLSDLRESGSIEQDADIVMFLYRDEYYHHDDTENKNIAEIIMAKNRNGATGFKRFKFDAEHTCFDELTRRES